MSDETQCYYIASCHSIRSNIGASRDSKSKDIWLTYGDNLSLAMDDHTAHLIIKALQKVIDEESDSDDLAA